MALTDAGLCNLNLVSGDNKSDGTVRNGRIATVTLVPHADSETGGWINVVLMRKFCGLQPNSIYGARERELMQR